MIHETAQLRVDPADAAAFEAAVARCVPLFRAASGFRSIALERQVEDSASYVLRVGWNSVDDHMVLFRGSAAFQQWRSTVGTYFAEPPVVVHHAPVALD